MPFLSPEFSNPLFLKISCNAIRKMKLKEFPKGLNGFNQVFEFYLNSLENIVKQKNGTHSNLLVHNAVQAFITELYPDNLWGVPYYEAIQAINSCGSIVSDSQSLLDQLLFEGLFSLDVIKNKNGEMEEIIKFTYERFCDYAVANFILSDCNTEEELVRLFSADGAIYKLINVNRYGNAGIIEALGIEIPEKYGKEFIEYIKLDEDNKWHYDWYLEETFQKGILSRTADSITEKSLELLNQLHGYPYHMPAMDILVSLSTEPNHPWNADFLDKNLRRRPLAERDLFWSTYVAVNDFDEDEEQPESPLRTLLNWVLDSELDNIDKERLRLTAIILLWFTTTSNRKIRQQATKCLSKVLYQISKQIVGFIERYTDIDDAYLVASLYGAVYGAVINIIEKDLIKEISDIVIQKQFNAKVDHPHFLVRDYARGIIEYAHAIGVLTDNIEQYRPPYRSIWPLENPLPSEIDAIDSQIKNSVQGYISDFGKYVMKDAECWTATSLTKKVAESERTLQYQFAETLPDDLKFKYIKLLDQKVSEDEKENSNFDLESLLAEYRGSNESPKYSEVEDEKSKGDLVYDVENNDDIAIMPPMIERTEEELIKEIMSKLGEADQEYFRWVRSQGISNQPAKFSHRWACRWVIKRAHELGWKKELFDDFEKTYCRMGYSEKKSAVERIGKKYQWIAYYELLARLADNLIFYDRGYSDVDDSKFYGPWQIDAREMDPTYLIKAKSKSFYDDTDQHWWRPYQFKLELDQLSEQKKWLWDKNNLPDLKAIICPRDNETGEEWLSLFSFCDWTTRAIKNKDEMGEPNLWYRVNSCIISQNNLDSLRASVINKPLYSPDIIYIPKSNNQRFLGEYPWHPCYDYIEDWTMPENWDRNNIPCEYHIPLFKYDWSSSSFSHMPDEYSSFYMPSKKIIMDMQLNRDIKIPSLWYKGNKIVFMDPSLQLNTQPCALFNRKVFCDWLRENNYVLVWLIGGEKQLFTRYSDKFYGRQVYSGLYSLDGNGDILGKSWSENELPFKSR